MTTQRFIVPIVEGKGEVDAVPLLIRRIAWERAHSLLPIVGKPIWVPRDKLLRRKGELERYVDIAARKGDSCGRILIVLDADDDCPAELGPWILGRATKARPDREVGVVLAKREYEAWFLATLDSLAGQRNIRKGSVAPDDPEGVRDAKGRINAMMGTGSQYRTTRDQAALTQFIDIPAARLKSPSFDKMCRVIEELAG